MIDDKVVTVLYPGGVGDVVNPGGEHGTGFRGSKPGGGPGGVKEGESRVALELAGVPGGTGDVGALKVLNSGGGP